MLPDPAKPVTVLEKKKTLIHTIGTSATLTSLGAATGAIMSIMAFLTYMHIDVIPFAWASDVKDIKVSIDSLLRQTLTLQRDNYYLQLQQAKDDLVKNPNSTSAKNEVDRLQRQIDDVNRQIAAIDAKGH